MKLWKRLVRWLAREELAELELQLALKKMEASLLELNKDMLSLIIGIKEKAIFAQGKLAGMKESQERYELLLSEIQNAETQTSDDKPTKKVLH